MYKSINANKRNTVIIMAAFVGVVGAIGWAFGYANGNTNIAYYVLAVALLYAVIQYFAAGKLAVAISGARQIKKSDNPKFYRIVENLAITTGLPTPAIYIIDDPSPNAFATGRDPKHAIVAATTGLINMMSDSELEAVMAHEMGHVQNYDIRVSMIAFGLASAVGLLSDIGLRMLFWGGDDRQEDNSGLSLVIGIFILVLSPIVASIIQMAISRQREYLADMTSAMTTRNPDAMISALDKLQANTKPMRRQNSATAHLFIVNPLKPGFISKLFSTHPPIEDRIERLRKNANKF